jgi:hypothetical protein
LSCRTGRSTTKNSKFPIGHIGMYFVFLDRYEVHLAIHRRSSTWHETCFTEPVTMYKSSSYRSCTLQPLVGIKARVSLEVTFSGNILRLTRVLHAIGSVWPTSKLPYTSFDRACQDLEHRASSSEAKCIACIVHVQSSAPFAAEHRVAAVVEAKEWQAWPACNWVAGRPETSAQPSATGVNDESWAQPLQQVELQQQQQQHQQ